MKSRALLLVIIFLCAALTPSYSQKSDRGKNKINVTGTVTDANNKPVSGAYVFVDKQGIGVISDENGRFKIKVVGAAKEIMVASPGKGFTVKPVEGNLAFVLNNPNETFPDFASKYIDESKTSIKANKPKKLNTYRDIYEMIRHEVPGVLVNGKSIVVQQPNSFLGSSTPLFVVNGVRVTSIDYINPMEVKSIQLLKGSYANIYGNEGANGVISITLLSGGEK